MSELTKNEEILLVAIWRLKNEAYGVNLKKYILELTGIDWNYGTLYCALDQLVKKGFSEKTVGEPTHERGGRRKIYYTPTMKGIKELQVSRDIQKALWNGIPDVAFETGKI